MSAGAYVPLIHGQLAELKKQCGKILHRPIRESIVQAENYIQSINQEDKLDLTIALQPFFEAMQDDHKLFQSIVLDCFFKVFKQASPDLFPGKSLTLQIINTMLHSDRAMSDELNLLCCNICISCLQSCSGIHYCHGALLRKMFRLLFRIYNNCENAATFNTIKTSIHETLLALFSAYTQPPEIPVTKNVDDLALQVTNSLMQNSISIIEFLDPILKAGDYKPTIRDVDVYVVISLLSRIIEVNKMKLRTINLAAEYLIFALSQDSKFFSTGAFHLLLHTEVHVAVLSLTLDTRSQLADPTSELLLLLWRKFAPIYNEGLNTALVKGLLTTFNSPNPQVITRTLQIFDTITREPQFFVDSFVNYDCDESGHFGNVFADSLKLIVKHAYPEVGTPTKPVQKQAIDVIVRILNALWEYFNLYENQKVESTSTEKPDKFLQAKTTKDVFLQGLDVFKRSFKKGLNFFVEHKFIEDNPESIAKFLFNTPTLDPIQVGEILGNKDRVEVLKEFVEFFDFKGVSFESAFRQFLSKFQIPGEAQMIDRVMEQFGTKFYNDNPTIFSCADTVYVLAFSTLMLHTDAHHPNVKSRMTFDQFLANNKGIDGGHDLPLEFLQDLYNGITSKRIFLSSQSNMPNSGLLTRAQKADLYKNQVQETINEARQTTGNSNEREFHQSKSSMFIGPMFQSIWGGVLASLTMTFKESNEEAIYKTCLRGLSLSVHIASHCFIENALDTLVDSFGTFTCLRRNINEAKTKNFDCTHELIHIALDDMNYLRGAWEIVMGEISAIDRIKDSYKFDTETIDDIFGATNKLDNESIVDFIRALCSTSVQELFPSEKEKLQPSIYLLEKLSIVAQMNMKRPRYIWIKIWDIVGNHLVKVGTSNMVDVAFLAVDIVRQLSSKFLMETELTQFHFQENFMKTISTIFNNQEHPDVREYLLQQIKVLVKNTAPNLQSGWATIFDILLISASIDYAIPTAFEIFSLLVKEALGILSSHFVHLFSILMSYIKNSPVEISVQAVKHYEEFAKMIPIEEVATWNSLFNSLTQCGQLPEDNVRRAAHTTFLNILKPELEDSVLNGVFKDNTLDFISASKENPHDPHFFESAIEFMTNLYNKIVDNWETFGKYYISHFTLLEYGITSIDNGLSSSSIEITQKFVNAKYNEYSDEMKVALIEMLKNVGTKINTLTLKNSKQFVAVLDDFAEKSDKDLRYLDIFEVSNETCEKEQTKIIWALIRSTLLKAMMRMPETLTDRIAECLNNTFSNFLKYEYHNDHKSPEGTAWNQAIVVNLTIINSMENDLFLKCFQTTKTSLLDMIRSQSSEVRKQISQAVQRKLL